MYAVLNSLEINFMDIISFNPHTVPSVITTSNLILKIRTLVECHSMVSVWDFNPYSPMSKPIQHFASFGMLYT